MKRRRSRSKKGVARSARRQKVWNKMIKSVLSRDGWKCTKCGSRKNLDIHHVTPKSEGGKHRMENLITLCKACHNKEHAAV